MQKIFIFPAGSGADLKADLCPNRFKTPTADVYSKSEVCSTLMELL